MLILAVPLFILLFLEQFGEQHYTIPTDPAEAEGLSAEVPAGALGRVLRLPAPLLNAKFKAQSNEDILGGILIAYFSSAAHPDTTELVLEKLARVQNVFEEDTLVRLLTVVPTKQLDTLLQLAQRYRSQPDRWMFLGDTTQAYVSTEVLPPGTNAATLVLVQSAKVYGYYDATQEKEVDRLVAEARILLYDAK